MASPKDGTHIRILYVYACVMVVYQPKRIKFGIIARSRAYGQFGCLVSTCQNCQTSFQNSHLKRKSFHTTKDV